MECDYQTIEFQQLIVVFSLIVCDIQRIRVLSDVMLQMGVGSVVISTANLGGSIIAKCEPASPERGARVHRQITFLIDLLLHSGVIQWVGGP